MLVLRLFIQETALRLVVRKENLKVTCNPFRTRHLPVLDAEAGYLAAVVQPSVEVQQKAGCVGYNQLLGRRTERFTSLSLQWRRLGWLSGTDRVVGRHLYVILLAWSDE